MKKIFIINLLLLTSLFAAVENGYELWLRYNKVDNSQLLKAYNGSITASTSAVLPPLL